MRRHFETKIGVVMERKPTICPCCSKVLFTLGVLAESEGTADGPIVRRDENGHFMRCRHCRKRVAFQSVAGDPTKTTYRLAPTQLCAPC